MNRYFEVLFASFSEEEEVRMWEMIAGVSKKNLPYHLWKDSLSDEERDFAIALAQKVDDEYYHLPEENSGNEMILFVETMLYYVTYDAEMGCELPAIGLLYGEATKWWVSD